jgi:hypothetical protein
MSERIVKEDELGALAKKLRVEAGKSRADVARELRVSAPCVFNAEEKPTRSLFRLRKRMIEKYSALKVVGPEYRLIEKSGS